MSPVDIMTSGCCLLTKDLDTFGNSFLCPLIKIEQVTKTFNIFIVHLGKSACYGFRVDFLTIPHFLFYLGGLIDVTAEFYAQ